METELVVFCKIGNMNGLNKAKGKIHMLQYETPIGLEDRYCRIRRTEENGKVDLVFTFKLVVKSDDNSKTRIEYNNEVTEDFFEGFKKICERYNNKTRYKFIANDMLVRLNINGKEVDKNVEEVVYEVDVFTDRNGKISEWCKIDVELDSIKKQLKNMYSDEVEADILLNLESLPIEPYSIMLEEYNKENKKLFDAIYAEHSIKL